MVIQDVDAGILVKCLAKGAEAAEDKTTWKASNIDAAHRAGWFCPREPPPKATCNLHYPF